MKILLKILSLSLFGMMISCNKNDDVNPEKLLNKFRVKEISGHNELWGDFKMDVEYQEDLVDKAWVINATKDTVGRLNPTAVLIKVPTLTPEEIEALPEGSVVPKAWKTIYSVSKALRGETVTRTTYEDNQVLKSIKTNFMYEYDDTLALDRKILKWRMFIGDNEKVDVVRMVYQYAGKQIASGEYSVYEANRWQTAEFWTYQYLEGRLTSIVVKSINDQTILEKEFVYSGNQIKIRNTTEQGIQVITYILNADGYVTRIDQGNGNYMEIKYETGHGNFSDFVPEAIRLQGDPYIK